jgi:hypothetical protein
MKHVAVTVVFTINICVYLLINDTFAVLTQRGDTRQVIFVFCNVTPSSLVAN